MRRHSNGWYGFHSCQNGRGVGCFVAFGVLFGNSAKWSGAQVGTFPSQSATVYSVTVGYDISARLFLEYRWQSSGAQFYDGVSIILGLRFQG